VSGFGRILEDLNEAGVEYVLVGGLAMIRHGVVRATRDIDAVFDPTEENVDRIRGLIGRWSATRPDGSAVRIEEVRPDRTIHLATPHGDLDLLSEKSPLSRSRCSGSAPTSKRSMGFLRRSAHSPTSSP
jgi:hypothetical protein